VAYYDALIAAWNSVTQPPTGVTGQGLLAGDTTAQKCTKINGWTMVGPVPAVVLISAWQLYDNIVVTEYDALTAPNQTIVNNILAMGNVNCASGSNARRRLLAVFPSGTTTNTDLTSLFASYYAPQQDWCFVNHYPTHGPSGPGNISVSDANNAGLV
jgi:hypothetical protein